MIRLVFGCERFFCAHQPGYTSFISRALELVNGLLKNQRTRKSVSLEEARLKAWNNVNLKRELLWFGY